MKIYVDEIPDNCNHCLFRENVSQHWEVEDYCLLTNKLICHTNICVDCPLVVISPAAKTNK